MELAQALSVATDVKTGFWKSPVYTYWVFSLLPIASLSWVESENDSFLLKGRNAGEQGQWYKVPPDLHKTQATAWAQVIRKTAAGCPLPAVRIYFILH